VAVMAGTGLGSIAVLIGTGSVDLVISLSN